MFVPPRDASAIDLISNTWARRSAASSRSSFARSAAAKRGVMLAPRALVRCRDDRRPRPRAARDLARGPGESRDSAVRDRVRSVGGIRRSGACPARGRRDRSSPPRWSRARTAHSSSWASACFLSLLLRERRYVGGAVLLLIGAALLAKGIAAVFLLKPAVWEHWLSPGVSTGVAAGALLLLAAHLAAAAGAGRGRDGRAALVAADDAPRAGSAVRAAAAVDVLLVVRPSAPFQRPHPSSCCSLWPLAASAYLFAAAGRPDWGNACASPACAYAGRPVLLLSLPA